ncbi:MAG: T9SS type A sorting domain-containing protein [Saprospiraceae bacterium]|nr:T9SS type A sorting domain-containing protein [Saprospiraceae bacterium]
MKHFIYCLVFTSFFVPLRAQQVALDYSFGNLGYVRTSIAPFATYGTIMDRTIDNRILLVGGAHGSDAGYTALVRYSTLGDSVNKLLLPYAPPNYPIATAIKSLPGGNVLIANASSEKELIKIRPDGTLDSTFGVYGKTPLFRIAAQEIIVDQPNRILVTGFNLNDFMEYQKGGYVLAYDMNGKPDSTFGENGRFRFSQGYLDFFFRILQQPDGKLLIAGFSIFGNTRYNSLIRLTEDGVLDESFGAGGMIFEQFTGNGENYGLIVQPDKKILICGYTFDPYQAVVVRYMPDGTRDVTFGDNGVVYLPGVHEATDMMLFPNGKILTYCWVNNEDNPTALFQLLPNGALDPEFGVNGVYFSPFLGFEPPMKMKLVDKNRLVGTGAVIVHMNNSFSTYLQLQGFLLSLNVGVVTPQEKPSVWAFPNPVSTSSEVGFSLETAETVAIDLYDMQGKLVSPLLTPTRFEAGEHQIPVWFGQEIAAGAYVIRVTVRGQAAVMVRVVKA